MVQCQWLSAQYTVSGNTINKYIDTMKLHWVSAALAYASVVSSTAVLLPLYVYPGDGAWNSVYKAIAVNPSVPFYVVVNPDDGPSSEGR